MGKLRLEDLAKKIRDIDFVMLQTKTDGGQIAGRPMSNNQDVEYDGDSYFFLMQESRTFTDIQVDANVNLAIQGSKSLLGAPGIFISVEGEAELIIDKTQFAAHWTSDLDDWYEEGIDTPGLALVKVHASRIHYWDGEDEGEITV